MLYLLEFFHKILPITLSHSNTLCLADYSIFLNPYDTSGICGFKIQASVRERIRRKY